MRKHLQIVHNTFTAAIHRVMDELLRDGQIKPTLAAAHAAITKYNLNKWTEDPLVVHEPAQLHKELVLQTVFSVLLPSILQSSQATQLNPDDTAKSETMGRQAAFAVILLMLLYRPGLEYRVRPERLGEMRRVAHDSIFDDCHDSMEWLLQNGAFATILWMRNGGREEEGDINIASIVPSNGRSRVSKKKRRKKSDGVSSAYGGSAANSLNLRHKRREILEKVVAKAAQRPEAIDGLLKGLADTQNAYQELKKTVINEVRTANKGRAWKSGINLSRSNLVEVIERLLNDIYPAPAAVEPVGPRQDGTSGPTVASVISKPAKSHQGTCSSSASTSSSSTSTSTSSSQTRSNTPFQAAEDMPAI